MISHSKRLLSKLRFDSWIGVPPPAFCVMDRIVCLAGHVPQHSRYNPHQATSDSVAWRFLLLADLGFLSQHCPILSEVN